MATGTRQSVRARNWRLVQVDSIFVGIVSASGTFLPVFLLRLGGTANDVGLITALPALTAFLLAIPLGRWLQGRRNIVPLYSRMRLLAWYGYALIAAIAVAVPPAQAIPAILVVWALASLPSTAGLVAFPIVMDGAAGKDGRFDLLGRRWAIAGLSTTIAVAIGGQFLDALPFPANFELLLVCITIAGIGSYLQSSRIQIPDQPRAASSGAGGPVLERVRGMWRLVAANRSFTRFELRSIAYTLSIGLAVPVLPVFYVDEVAASDAWIGIIGAAISAGSVLGYLAARQLALRGGGGRALLPSLLAMAVAPAVLAVVDWLPAVAAVAFAIGVAGAGAQLALFDGLMRRIPAEQGVTFSSVDQSVQNLAFIVAPNLGGILAVGLGARAALLIAAAVGAAAFALFAIDARDRDRREGRDRLDPRLEAAR